MAKRTSITTHDDIDGTSGAKTVRFSLEGSLYEIDLASQNEQELREVLAPYINAGRKVKKENLLPTSPRAKSSDSYNRHDTYSARKWLAANGHNPPARGRLSEKWLDVYEQSAKS